MSRTPSYAKSPWSQKVNSFLFESPFRTPFDGILRNHRPPCIARCDPTSTDARGDAEEAQGSRPSKVYAWKRRRKRPEGLKDAEGGTTVRRPVVLGAQKYRAGPVVLGKCHPPISVPNLVKCREGAVLPPDRRPKLRPVVPGRGR